jgi:hypothetical protein
VCPTEFKKACPTTPPRRNCVTTTCSRRPDVGLVTVSNCFGRRVDRITIEHTRRSGDTVCNKQREQCDEGRLFRFTAPCNSKVTLYLSDRRYVPNGGASPLDLSGSTCAPRFSPRKLCSTCGPYEFTVTCPTDCDDEDDD